MRAIDLLVFVAEVAVYVCAAWAAWALLPHGPLAALGAAAAVLVMAAWWGLLHSPKATVRLPHGLDLTLRAVWFGIGLAAAVAATVSGPSVHF